MKSLLVSVILLASTSSFAASYQLPQKSTALTLLTSGNVSVETQAPKCPPTAMCEAVSVLKIQFTLPGCVDKLGPVTIKETGFTTDGKKKYLVTAYNVNNETSKFAKCIRAPIGVASQVIGLGYMTTDSVVVEFTQTTANSTTF